MISATGEACPVGSKKREVRLQHRSIDVGDATLECILCGSGAPVVLLANAGCSTGGSYWVPGWWEEVWVACLQDLCDSRRGRREPAILREDPRIWRYRIW